MVRHIDIRLSKLLQVLPRLGAQAKLCPLNKNCHFSPRLHASFHPANVRRERRQFAAGCLPPTLAQAKNFALYKLPYDLIGNLAFAATMNDIWSHRGPDLMPAIAISRRSGGIFPTRQ